jgi:hypothetical protein
MKACPPPTSQGLSPSPTTEEVKEKYGKSAHKSRNKKKKRNNNVQEKQSNLHRDRYRYKKKMKAPGSTPRSQSSTLINN